MAAPAYYATKSNMVVKGVTALRMVKLNLSCYSDSSNEFSGCQVNKGHITATWILLDIQLTLNLFNNEDLLTVIRTVANQSNVYTYIGMKSTKEVGHLPLFKLDT